MNAYGERLFVIAAVKNTDAPPFRKRLGTPPQIVMSKVLTGRGFERKYLTPLRINARHHVFDRAIFASCIHRLEYQKHGPLTLCVEHVLQFCQHIDTES